MSDNNLTVDISRLCGDVHRLRERARDFTRLHREVLLTQILSLPRYSDERCLNHFEAQVYSQHGEDGIISELFRRVGVGNRSFVEIGVGDGRENNTLYRLSQGWHGFWFDGSSRDITALESWLSRELSSGQLVAVAAHMNRENACDILNTHGVPEDIDLLSLDIDLNTSYLWRGLSHLTPRVVVVEYSAAFPPSDEWEVEYSPDALWDGSSYCGASLKTFEIIGRSFGYTLVGCELSGTNAFFVRRDLIDEQFVGPFTAERLYEPPRYFLSHVRGHPKRRYGPSAHLDEVTARAK